MALYYKFKSAKHFTKFPICDRYITVGDFKNLIFESKIGRGKDFDLIVTNADTNEDYVNEYSSILANTKLLLRRIPGLPRKAIVVVNSPAPDDEPIRVKQETEKPKASASATEMDIIPDSEWDEIFDCISSSTVTLPTAVEKPVQTTKIETRQEPTTTMTRNLPPEGYICHRCNVAGHFIKHCPTNGDPNYDFSKMKVSTGKQEIEEIKRIPSVVDTRFPCELYCKLCNKIMESSVMTRCCFESFCDKCIRDYIASHSKCKCGKTTVVKDNLFPNLTLRKIIDGRMASCKSKQDNKNGSEIPQDTKDTSTAGKSLVTNDETKVSSKSSNMVEVLAAKNYAMSMPPLSGYNSCLNLTTPGLPYGMVSTAADPYTSFDPYISNVADEQSFVQMSRSNSREDEACQAAPKRKHESLREHNDRDMYTRHDSSKKLKTNH